MVPLFTPSLAWKGRKKVMLRLSLLERTDACPKLTASEKKKQNKTKSATDLPEFEATMILTNNNQELGSALELPSRPLHSGSLYCSRRRANARNVSFPNLSRW